MILSWTAEPLPSSAGDTVLSGKKTPKRQGNRTKAANAMKHLSVEELEAALDDIRQSPSDSGRVEMIVRRPAVDLREALEEAELDPSYGLAGDSWLLRQEPGSPQFDRQINVMNSRAIAAIAQNRERWPLAGDQLFVDFDLSVDNLPVGACLAIGGAILEVATPPHLGCRKFGWRYGGDAVKFVNSTVGKQLRLRGLNARVIQGGTVRVGDAVKKL